MIKNLSQLIVATIIGFTATTQAQQIQFSPISNVEMMIANIFGVQCEGVSNVIHSPILQAIGRFENGGIIGVNSGIVMSTGHIQGTGSSSDNFNSTGPFFAGDNDINQYGILNGLPSQSYDACFVEFDFNPLVSDTIRFTYILASEEYPEYSNSQYTDRFMFLVSENSAPAVNIAVIPGTTTAVEINSINQMVNSQYYVDNSSGPSSGFFIYDGYTTPLEAKFFAQVGSTYHIKLVIADISDGVYDSALFLEEQASYNDISGDLMVNGSLAEGLLEIFNFVGDTAIALPVYSAVVTNGQYSADSLTTGMYHVRFTPDPVLFPGTAPLYFTNGDTWSTAQEIGLPCFLDNGNINSTDLPVLNGSATISGIISIDTSFTKAITAPFEGAIVKLLNQSNQTIAFTYSNVNGEYNFSNIPNGTYHILIDVPYIPQVNLHHILVTGNEIYSGADFSILTDGIHAENNLALGLETNITFDANIYPNPATDKLTIVHNSNESMEYVIQQLDGKVAQAGIIGLGKSELNISELPNGVYLISLGNQKRSKLIISRNN